MPFSLTNAPSTFQSLMNSIFQPYFEHFVLVFFDLILVYSKNWYSHLTYLQQVFDVLKQHSLFVKLSKCAFGATKVEYLGHVISVGKVSMDSSKIIGVLDWPVPSLVKELRDFLGLTGYYRRFIHRYGLIVKPLIELLKKEAFQWTPTTQVAFDNLKQAMISAPVFTLPNFTTEFIVEADASQGGIWAVLTQKGKPVAYFSKALIICQALDFDRPDLCLIKL